MECCNAYMNLIAVYDQGVSSEREAYAYNLYQCYSCGALCKEDVWSNAGITWITVDGSIQHLN